MTNAVPKACIVGDPVAHSRSPMIHGYWLRRFGIDGAYERAHVKAGELADFVHAMRDNGFVGANVTVPHKERIFALADDVSERARAVGAANTIWYENDRLRADNTDVPGFLAHLDDSHGDWEKTVEQAVVLGAGGAARAITYALASRGVGMITLANRNIDRAEALAREFARGRTTIRAVGWAELPQALKGAGLLVNATSLGMTHQPPLDCPLDGLRDDAIVNDIVYAPLETDLLRRARERGFRSVDGLGMLLHQAVPGFARWFGATPAVTPELRALIAADIEKTA